MYRFADPYVQSLFEQAIRAGGDQSTQVYARRGTIPLYADDSGAETSLPLLEGGSITDRPGTGGVRRSLRASFADVDDSVFDLLRLPGTSLVVEQTVSMVNGDLITLPAGVFDVDVTKTSLGPAGSLSVEAPDMYARIQRAKFIRPVQSRMDYTVPMQIAALVRGALGTNYTVLNYSLTRAQVPNVIWETDRAKAIEELATAAGLHVGFDREGRCYIVDLPTIGRSADWLVDASPSGVLIGGDRQVSRRSTANVVKVSPDTSDADGPRFQPVVVWDTDPDSSTYAGPDPENYPEYAGPFGVAVFPYSSPLITEPGQATQAAQTILAKTVGTAASLSLTAVRNPALEAFDVIDVLPPRRQPLGALRTERHIVDSVTHPLDPGGVQTIEGRSTRTDEYGG